MYLPHFPVSSSRGFRRLGGLLLACAALVVPGFSRADAVPPPVAAVDAVVGQELSLDGVWSVGEDQNYSRDVPVPGLAQDPSRASRGTLWYRRSVTLPGGDWVCATLVLHGARFAPVVYVNNQQVSAAEGGMATTVHVLKSPEVAPGRVIQLEIALKSLDDLDPQDASVIPGADRFRSNSSSGLWDSVRLHFSGAARIERVTPWTDFAARTVDVHWAIAPGSDGALDRPHSVRAAVVDAAGREVAESARISVPAGSRAGVARIELGKEIQPWSPDSPTVYRLRVALDNDAAAQDRAEITWGLREFKTAGVGFLLNGEPVRLRAGTFVWHRFVRDPEARTLAFDTAWFEKNVGQRLRDLGANTIRFHLGLPPEALLDYCDRAGFLVQMEWSFFHGLSASPESLRVQWRTWLETAMRHPSVALLHPWNETTGDQLKKAHAALADLTPDFPPLVVSHRDVIHVHKYWWSLFENLGLYFDSASEFPQPIMADEFGGNYLDRKAGPGAYPTVRETYLRFLGREQTPELRLRHHAESNALVAEYWRRLGAAGFSPFCIAGSPQDGNSWFLGSLADPKPMPVWAALSAAMAPQSVSLAIWNRNFTPAQSAEVPLYFFNDRAGVAALEAVIRIVAAADGRVVSTQTVSAGVPAFGTEIRTVRIKLPAEVGDWRIEAELRTPVAGVPGPIVSAWRCRTLAVVTPDAVRGSTFAVPSDETELRALLEKHGARVTGLDDPSARALVLGLHSWQALTQSADLRAFLELAVKRGQAVVLLDVGPRDLERYQNAARRNLEGAPWLGEPRTERHPLFAGIELVFREAAEPESHLHPALDNDRLWAHLPRESTWLWNGLRGGLIVPPFEFDVTGLSSSAFLALWGNRGAEPAALKAGEPAYAYELGGYYAFSKKPKDEAVIAELRRKVKFLFDDAPALQGRLDPDGPILTTDLAAALRTTGGGSEDASELVPLANCGKNLTRVPIVMASFGPNRGRVVISQVLTAGRLVGDGGSLRLYELGHDPAAEQFALNLIALSIAP